jgi:hypothetical protein
MKEVLMAKVTATVAVEDRWGDLHSPDCPTLTPSERRRAAKAQAEGDELAARLERTLNGGGDRPKGQGHATGVSLPGSKPIWDGTAGKKLVVH